MSLRAHRIEPQTVFEVPAGLKVRPARVRRTGAPVAALYCGAGIPAVLIALA